MTIYGCGYTYIHTDHTRLLKGFRSGPEGHIDEAIFSGYTAYSPHSFPWSTYCLVVFIGKIHSSRKSRISKRMFCKQSLFPVDLAI